MKVSQRKIHNFRHEFTEDVLRYCGGLGLPAEYVDLRAELGQGVLTVHASSQRFFWHSAQLRVGSMDKLFLRRLLSSFQSLLEAGCKERRIGLVEGAA